MSNKPIFVATHPRACSTAFERVFMTRRDTIQCIHEPFGDAFYYGPERLSQRFADDEQTRIESGFSLSTFKTVLDRIDREASEGKRIFIKDIIHYLLPPGRSPVSIAPSLDRVKRGVGTDSGDLAVTVNGSSSCANGHTAETKANGTNGVANNTNGHANGFTSNGTATEADRPFETDPEPGNPTVIPRQIMERFHFVFLIRDPHYSVPSYYRCTIPPLANITGFHNYDPSEAGYDEVRRTFDFLRQSQLIGPHLATRTGEVVDVIDGKLCPTKTRSENTAYDSGIEICVVDADEMLQNPEHIMAAFCDSVGIEFDPAMLSWDSDEDYQHAVRVFEKWRGFHNDVIESARLTPKKPQHPKPEEQYDAEWRARYGEDAAKLIRQTVDENMADYLYMRQFALKA